MKPYGTYAGKGWNKESIGLGKGKEWLLSSLCTLPQLSWGDLILSSSWFLRYPGIDHLSSDTIVICIYDTQQIFIEPTMCCQRIKQRSSEPYWNIIIRIIVITIATNWVYFLVLWEERQAEVQAAVSNLAGQHGRGNRGVSAEMWGLVTCGSGLKSPAQELGYFFPG